MTGGSAQPSCGRVASRHTAWATVSTRSSSTPGGPSGDEAGTSHPVEAQAGALGQTAGQVGDLADLAGQSHLPDRDQVGGSDAPVVAEATARATARSAAGSVTLIPPATEANTSTPSTGRSA